MCGIAGELVFYGSRPVDRGVWEKISALMSRRGPDDDGFWTDNACCTLVFRRLAIIDLSSRGHQPMTAVNDRYALVFNGEVYNFRDLRKRLESHGVHFHSNSDSEVVLRSLIEWGIDAIAQFNGMFALGFYDSVERRLLLARDHAGIKPLYYLTCPRGVVFASQYNQLLTHPWSHDLGTSEDSLGLYLRLAYIPAPYALKKSTNMLEPGMWMEIHADGKIEKGSYYSFPYYVEPSLKGEKAIEAVDEAITSAVKRQLVSDVPVGAFLSGGIDSPLVVAKMASASNNTIRAYTIGTNEEETNEAEDARMYAQEIGIEHIISYISPDQAIDIIDDVIEACGEPLGDYSMFPTLLVSQLARRDSKVVLSGDGGDELFWGYPYRFGTLLNLAQEFRMPHLWRKAKSGVDNLVFSGNGNDFLLMKTIGDCHRSMLTHLPEKLLKEIFPSLPDWPSECKAFSYAGWKQDQIAQSARWNEFVYHLTMVLMKVDRASMYHSLEVRVPLLDREVIAIAANVDWRTCLDLDRMIGKMPLRKTLARSVRYQTRSKRGFEVPMGTWLRTSLKGFFEDFVLNKSEILGLEIDRKSLSRIFSQHIDGKVNHAWGLWPLLSLALWDKRHNKEVATRISV